LIRQGEVYWVDIGRAGGSGPALRHPHVVVQNDLFNRSRLATVVVCVVTTSLERARAPGNVLLEAGEASLPRSSVVNVSQLFTVDKEELVERIGALTPTRLREVLDGVELLLEPRDIPE
jgi:mRNA interferase MazF